MSNILRTILALTMLGALLLASCSSETSQAEADTDTSTAVPEPVEIARADGDSPAPAPAPQASGPSAERYAEILAEIKVLQSQATDQASTQRVLGEIETMFKDFLKAYPDTEESKDANFQLGMMYMSIQRQPLGIPYLQAFLKSSDGLHSDKVGYTHFYLAEGYRATDKFEKAAEHYKIVINEYPSLNPQLLAMAQANMQDLDTLKQLRIGADAIPIEFTDLDGQSVSLDKLKGKVVLIDFWATWCRPCIAEMPNVIKLHDEYKKKGFEIVGISLDRDKGALQRYISQNKMTWPQQFDGKGWGNDIAAKYKVRSIPATYLLDREGKIRYRSIRGPQLEKAVEELIKEKA